jgi:hypothetical protein
MPAWVPDSKKLPHHTARRLVHLDGSTLSHPPLIHVVWLDVRSKILIQVAVVFDGEVGARIQPLVNFGMPVSKAETAGAIVVVGWDIDPSRCRSRAWYRHAEEGVIDAVRMLIGENPKH